VLAIIAAGVAGVLTLWWRDTPQITGLGDALTGAGRILGLLAGYGVVVLVALMARLPPLERGVGASRLARWHAMGGRYIITIIAAHAVLITWGYAVTAHQRVATEAGTLLTSYPDVLMATVAAGLLLGVGLVSARLVRRRLAYETWYHLHFYTYLAIALAFSHQFANGASFIDSLDDRVAWSALYATVAALVLWYRVITPLRRLGRHRFRVAGLRSEAPGIVSVYIAGDRLEKLHAEPGQFFRWRFLTRGMWWQSHPYSLSALPRPDMMRITVKARGDHSGGLARLRPGTRVLAEGPFGAFTPARSRRGVVLIAGGVGITPIRAMFAAMPAPAGRSVGAATLIYRASHPQDIVFRRELDQIAASRGAAVHYLTGSRYELGTDPLSARNLAGLVPGLHRRQAYVCGPPGMTETAIRALRAAGVPRRRIHHESFDF
jgi:ferredoxin-NADP reductase/DMSO/TMAO reductase YedYZ heme-binding membrane subunit